MRYLWERTSKAVPSSCKATRCDTSALTSTIPCCTSRMHRGNKCCAAQPTIHRQT
jgi:hypothetical protein